MALYNCNRCENSWEVTGPVTMRVRGGKIRNFDDNDNPIDICTCGNVVEQTKTTEGWGGIVKAHTGTVGNFKRS